jgi:predicted peptidase
MVARWLLAYLLLVVLSSPAALQADEPAAGKQVALQFTGDSEQSKVGYLLFLPKQYDTAPQKWPVILFLHGAGERGDDLNQVKRHGPPKLVEADPDFGFIVISPQCPKGVFWNGNIETLKQLVDHVAETYQVDRTRIYLTGLSMGGYGSWAMAAQYPELFAAVVPICGGGQVETAEKLKGIPLWVFHGGKDTVVSLDKSQAMVDAVKAAGGNVEFTIYPDAGHDSWTATYNNPQLYEWLLKHTSDPK